MTVNTLDQPTTAPAPDEFTLDMRVIETLNPGRADCDTSDGCGTSCATTACNTGSADPI